MSVASVAVRDFLKLESASGILLVIAGVAAMLGLAVPGGYTPPQSVFRVGVQP